MRLGRNEAWSGLLATHPASPSAPHWSTTQSGAKAARSSARAWRRRTRKESSVSPFWERRKGAAVE